MSPQFEAAINIENPAALVDYLRRRGILAAGEEPVVQVLTGGVSNRTVLVQRASGEAWVLKQALPKLRVPVDWFSAPERIFREALGVEWLSRLVPGSIPQPVFQDPEQYLFAMEAVPQPHENWKQQLMRGGLKPDHAVQFGRLLGTIHRAAERERAVLEPLFADTTFFESLRLEPYYEYSAVQAPAAAAFIDELLRDTRARRLTLVHGDYSPKNTLVCQGRLFLLDHEVIHWGDPAFDLGFSLTHLLSKAHHLVRQRAELAEAARVYYATYRETLGDVAWGADLEGITVRHTLGCLLARVVGRSQLEYLSEAEKERQRTAVLQLMSSPPADVSLLIVQFASLMDAR